MSGHSKWHSIKHKKGVADARRGQEFTKLANAIAIAAKDGADPEMNFKLRLAIDKAKSVNMPNVNIEKSILRGSGQLKGEQIEEILYEGYGPGGIAVMVLCATDNKNRTLTDVRTALIKNDGRLAEAGSVAFQFEQKGIISLEAEDPETAALSAIDAGAQDVEEDGNSLTVYTSAKELNMVRQNLQELRLKIESAELAYVPQQTVEIKEAEVARKVLKLMDSLEELDDVSATFSNFDIPSEIIESL
jgi:YebC/PmpR family DNA-binding regulatory protein